MLFSIMSMTQDIATSVKSAVSLANWHAKSYPSYPLKCNIFNKTGDNIFSKDAEVHLFEMKTTLGNVYVAKWQGNEHYDPEKTHNGGGYDQPQWVIETDNGNVIHVSDNNIGEFGEEISVWVENGPSAVWGMNVNKSDFEEHDPLLRVCGQVTGILPPDKKEIKEYEEEQYEPLFEEEYYM